MQNRVIYEKKCHILNVVLRRNSLRAGGFFVMILRKHGKDLQLT